MILTISEDNYITVLDSLAEAERQPESVYFSNLDELTELTAEWPTSRLVEIWNNLPGVAPVKKFKDRPTAVTRIWRALQSMDESAAIPTQGGEPAETEPAATNHEIPVETAETANLREPNAPTPVAEEEPAPAPQTPDVAPAKEESPKKTTRVKRERTGAPREGSKTEIILSLLRG